MALMRTAVCQWCGSIRAAPLAAKASVASVRAARAYFAFHVSMSLRRWALTIAFGLRRHACQARPAVSGPEPRFYGSSRSFGPEAVEPPLSLVL